jgi:multidrug efflux pump subunit AcrA (membrane-fusion protein)
MKAIIASHHLTLVTLAGVTAALSMSTVFAGCSERTVAAADADAPQPIVVEVVKVAMTDVNGTIDSGGVVQARTTATIAARIMAPVREILVWPGDRVRKGQTLVALEGDDLAAGARAARSAAIAAEQGARAAGAELLGAEAGLILARASHNRIAGLETKRSATAQELDDATAVLRSAEARVAGATARALQAAAAVESARAGADQASTTHSFTRIAAPFDGTITARMIDPGNMASPGTPLLRLEDTRGFRLEVRVDESRIGEIRNGDRVRVFVGSTSIEGTVAEVSRAVETDARAFLVKVALPDVPGVRSGEFGKARFAGTPRRALTVPSAAVVRRGQITSVFVVDHGIARARLVSLSESEVLAGLTEAEMVILSPPAAMTDGHHVHVGGR